MGQHICFCNKDQLDNISIVSNSNFDSTCPNYSLSENVISKSHYINHKKLRVGKEECNRIKRQIVYEKIFKPWQYKKYVKSAILIQGHWRNYISKYPDIKRYGPENFDGQLIDQLPKNITKTISQYLLTHETYQDDDESYSDTEDTAKGCLLPAVELNSGGYYVGTWYQKKRTGKGLFIWDNGSIYDGDFLDNKIHGYGRFIGINDEMYEGEWKNDKMDGKGYYHNNHGSKYNGDWMNDLQHGFGVETWPDGAVYEGEFDNGTKCGQGRFSFENGDVYVGEFHNNNFDRTGTYRYLDGRNYNGAFVNGKKHGEGVFLWPDKQKYKGSYENDEKNGYGVLEWPNKRRYEGNWMNGMQQGWGRIFDEFGIFQEGSFTNGILRVDKNKKADKANCRLFV